MKCSRKVSKINIKLFFSDYLEIANNPIDLLGSIEMKFTQIWNNLNT